jgi:hypothetical protein
MHGGMPWGLANQAIAQAMQATRRQHVGAGPASSALSLWSSGKGQAALGNAKSLASQLSVSFSPSLGSQAADYVFNTEIFANIAVDPVAVANIVDLIANGQYGEAAVASIELTMSTVGGPVGMAMAAVVGLLMIVGDDEGSPCTCPGCGGTFGLAECPQGNMFNWDFIASQLPAMPPLSSFHFSGNPNMGPTNLLDWGSYDWMQGQGTSWNFKGGPGSFEEALEKAIMSAWDTAAQAPIVCQTIQAIIAPPPGTKPGPFGPANQSDGSVMGPNPASAATRAAVGTTLCITAGMLLAGFVTAWNKAHQGPQRKITYTVPQPGGVPLTDDPIAPAFWGLAWAAGKPAGSTISVVINDPRGASVNPACWPLGSKCLYGEPVTSSETNVIPPGQSLIHATPAPAPAPAPTHAPVRIVLKGPPIKATVSAPAAPKRTAPSVLAPLAIAASGAASMFTPYGWALLAGIGLAGVIDALTRK